MKGQIRAVGKIRFPTMAGLYISIKNDNYYAMRTSRRNRLSTKALFFGLLTLSLLINIPLLLFHDETPSSSFTVIHEQHLRDIRRTIPAREQEKSASPRKNDEKWERTKQWLCPSSLINMTAAVETFRRAQKIGLPEGFDPADVDTETDYDSDDSSGSDDDTTSTKAIRTFFLHWPGHVSIREKSTNHTATFLRTYKCGSITLRDYFEQVLKRKKGFDNFHTSLYYRSFVNNRIAEKSNCICTTFRDPINHFLSGLEELEMRRNSNPWKKRVTKLAPYEKLQLVSEERFFAFVDYLLRAKWLDVFQYRNGFFEHDFGHVLPQSAYFQFLKRRNSGVTAFIDMRNIANETPLVLNGTCGFSKEAIPALLEKKTHEKLPGMSFLHKSLWANASRSSSRYPLFHKFEALCLLHAIDYACLSPVLKTIPEICKNAYHKYLGTGDEQVQLLNIVKA